MLTQRVCQAIRANWASTLLLGAAVFGVIDTATGGKPGGGSPTPAQLNPAIAFVAVQTNGREDIVVAAGDLASETVITKSLKPRKGGRLEMGSPAWSPDGARVAFWVRDWLNSNDAKIKLYVASGGGSGLTLIRDFSAQPGPRPAFASDGLNWSPTGNELVYAASGALVAVDPVSGSTRVLLSDDRVGHPSLSPDLDSAPGYQGFLATTGPDGSGSGDLYVVPIEDDGNGDLLPIDAELIENISNSPGSLQAHPSWSPDGSEIAYFDDEGLAVLDVASGQERILPGGFFTSGAAQDRASWTSNGQSLVYRSPAVGPGDLAITSAGSGGPQRYTTTTSRLEYAPAWNPQWNPTGPGGF